MTLQDYTTEELRAELKRRTDLAKAEKAKVKRCRMCKHWGEVEVDYFGNASGIKHYKHLVPIPQDEEWQVLSLPRTLSTCL